MRKSPKAERNAEIVALVLSGISKLEVARRYGLSRSRVWQLCFEAGLPMRTRTIVTPEMKAGIVKLARSGLCVAGIAEVFDVDRGVICRALSEAGIDAVGAHDVFGPEARAKAIGLVRSGLTYAEAAEETGMTRSAVAGACHRAGLRIEKRSVVERRSCAALRAQRAKAEMEDA